MDRVFARLDALALLQDGWLLGQGIAPIREVVRLSRFVLFELLAGDVPAVPPPRLYCTEHGAIQAEWLLGNISIDLVFWCLPSYPAYAALVVSIEGSEPVEYLYFTQKDSVIGITQVFKDLPSTGNTQGFLNRRKGSEFLPPA